MPSGSIAKVCAAAALALLAASCNRGPKPVPVIGEAYVGPAVLKIRSDFPVQSSTVANVQHGDRLEILQKHRAFFRVRTTGGAVGWADERQLLAASDMANLKRLAAVAAKLPPQGAATPRYGDLRIYTQPSLESPSFVTVREGDKIDVVAHAAIPRTGAKRTPLLPPTPKKAPPKKKSKESKYSAILVPMPKPPSPPPDLAQLSKTEQAEAKEEADIAAAPPKPTDDWSLVRTSSGQTGWTLTRRLNMAIPDEVAQYAEGHRLVAYFSLATVLDGDTKKDIWLWATVADGVHPYDFDSFRVFDWSLRHHRYETAYIERNLAGFEPVMLEQVELTPTGKGAGRALTGKYPGFSLCIQKKDGQRYRRAYALLGNMVRYAGDRPCEAPPSVQNLIAASSKPAPVALIPPPEQPKDSMVQRMKKRVHSWFEK